MTQKEFICLIWATYFSAKICEIRWLVLRSVLLNVTYWKIHRTIKLTRLTFTRNQHIKVNHKVRGLSVCAVTGQYTGSCVLWRNFTFGYTRSLIRAEDFPSRTAFVQNVPGRLRAQCSSPKQVKTTVEGLRRSLTMKLESGDGRRVWK